MTEYPSLMGIEYLRAHLRDEVSSDEKILIDQIEDFGLVISLFQQENEEIMKEILKIRAIDQKGTADYITQKLFNPLFKDECKPRYNNFIQVSKDLQPRMVYNLANKVEYEKFLQELQLHPQKYIKREIDGMLLLKYKTTDKEQYQHIEIKLFTIPHEPDAPTKILRRHLQKNALVDYFEINHYLGLIGFSYVSRENKPKIPCPHLKLRELGIPSTWVFHLVLLNKKILDLKLNAKQKAEQVLSYLSAHGTGFLQNYEAAEAQKLKIRPTYNLVKVMVLIEYMETYKRELEALRKRVTEQEKALNEKDKALNEKDKALNEKDKALNEKDKRIAELKKQQAQEK